MNEKQENILTSLLIDAGAGQGEIEHAIYNFTQLGDKHCRCCKNFEMSKEEKLEIEKEKGIEGYALKDKTDREEEDDDDLDEDRNPFKIKCLDSEGNIKST